MGLWSTNSSAPDAELDTFVYHTYTRAGDNHRFGKKEGGSFTISGFKFRGLIPAPTRESIATNGLEEELKRLQAAATRYPKAEPLLAPSILQLERLVAAQEEKTKAIHKIETQGEKIELGGKIYNDFNFKSFENGRLKFSHAAGFGAIELSTLTTSDLETAVSIAEKARVPVGIIAGKTYFDFRFKNIYAGKVIFSHCGSESEEIPFTILTKSEKSFLEDLIGDRKLQNPGFYGYEEPKKVYDLFVFPDGRYLEDVTIAGYTAKGMTLKGSGMERILTPGELKYVESTISAADLSRVHEWKAEEIERLFEAASEEQRREFVRQVDWRDQGKLPIAISLKIKVFQVIPSDGGILSDASRLEITVGERHYNVQSFKRIKNPFTGSEEERVTDTWNEKSDWNIVEELGFAFIETPTSSIHEDQVLEYENLKRDGVYQYTDVAGRPRSVPKWTGDLAE